jgi:nucleoside-diphosphate-sugar epimerase
MSILVTGGAGFLGSHVVDRFIEGGERVVVIDDLSSGRIANVERALSSGSATFVYGDVGRSKEAVAALAASARAGRFTAIYHLAALGGIGTHGCIELALAHGATLVFASASDVYGESLVASAIRENGLRARIVRLFDAYGPRMPLGDGRLIPSLVQAANANRPLPIHGSGRQTCSLVYVADVVDGLLVVERAARAEPLPVDLGCAEEYAVLEIAELVAAAAGVPLIVEHGEPRLEEPLRRTPDVSRALALGWTASTGLEAGLRMTYDWCTAHAALYG